MGLVYNEKMCVDTGTCLQTINKAYYEVQSDTGGTLVTSLKYALNQPLTISDYSARQTVDVNSGTSLFYTATTEASIASIHNLYSLIGDLYQDIEEQQAFTYTKSVGLNQTAFYDDSYPLNGTTPWPTGAPVTSTASVPWDGSARTVLAFAIGFFVAALICVCYSVLRWWRGRGEEQTSKEQHAALIYSSKGMDDEAQIADT